MKWMGVLAACVLLSGCGGSNDYSPAAGTSPDKIYAEACAGCHGDKGAGKMGFLLKVAGSDAEPAAMAAHIKEGGMVMPAFPNIGDADRMAIALYLKSL
ncbi:cytochrome c, class I [Magnetococcus marinus MC-1]|uniref:Cytochrome c, class I n=1 Tax=Magnetococcus marinus (strain ATCC BAA-1437 / JCM 17883 / MC-1) TaxID=156889 RepID=A0L6L8_MAGMM|nr:cytochrome c [Magnetococcus marinus]ABK43611.1 cytochrome c, class I [Magnetococcus marinus MC-1]